MARRPGPRKDYEHEIDVLDRMSRRVLHDTNRSLAWKDQVEMLLRRLRKEFRAPVFEEEASDSSVKKQTAVGR